MDNMNARIESRQQYDRVLKALTETLHAKERAERYRFDLRDHALIAFYDRHIAKLSAMLDSLVVPEHVTAGAQ